MNRLALVAAVLLIAAAAGPAVAAPAAAPDVSADKVVVDLEGKAITVSEIPTFYCHDRDFPKIHCYRSGAKADLAVREFGPVSAAAASATDYVIVYSSPSYAGSYFYVSQNYDVLAIIGWNDRIRSYRAQNSGQGVFWTDWLGNGTGQAFCCNQTVPVLSATLDRQFSSVYRR